VELSEVVAEMVQSSERIQAAGAPWVVAVERLLLRVRCVTMLVMSVKVRPALEGLGCASRVQAAHGIVSPRL